MHTERRATDVFRLNAKYEMKWNENCTWTCNWENDAAGMTYNSMRRFIILS